MQFSCHIEIFRMYRSIYRIRNTFVNKWHLIFLPFQLNSRCVCHSARPCIVLKSDCTVMWTLIWHQARKVHFALSSFVSSVRLLLYTHSRWIRRVITSKCFRNARSHSFRASIPQNDSLFTLLPSHAVTRSSQY